MANNPGRPIPPNKVLAFNTREEVDKWLFDNPVRCPGALHFNVINGNVISYGIQTNSGDVMKRRVFEDPTFKFQIPLQLAAEREIARTLIGDPNFPWVVSLKEFAHPPGEASSTTSSAITMMGLFDTAYWLSWITWEGLLVFISSLVTVIVGMIFQFDIFLRNNFIAVFLLFFLFQLAMTTFAYWLSAFMNKSASATTVAFCIFIVGFITLMVSSSGYPYSPGDWWSLFPPNLLTAA